MNKQEKDSAYSYLVSRKKNNKKYHLLRKYGLSIELYNHMLKAQDNKCAICKRSFDKVGCAVDHNHTTYKTRELLCLSCNSALGMFREDLSVIRNAILYLEKWQ